MMRDIAACLLPAIVLATLFLHGSCPCPVSPSSGVQQFWSEHGLDSICSHCGHTHTCCEVHSSPALASSTSAIEPVGPSTVPVSPALTSIIAIDRVEPGPEPLPPQTSGTGRLYLLNRSLLI